MRKAQDKSTNRLRKKTFTTLRIDSPWYKDWSGRIIRRRGDYLLDFGDGKVERLSLQPAIVVEHFDPQTLYPNGNPTLEGAGTMVRN